MIIRNAQRALCYAACCLAVFSAALASTDLPTQTKLPVTQKKPANSVAQTVIALPIAANASKTLPGLTSEMLNQYLLAEIAGQRGDYSLAQHMMLELAKDTQNAKVAQRAAELAFQSRQSDAALDATVLWLQLEPESTRARQALALLVNAQGSLLAATSKLESFLRDDSKRPILFIHLAGLLSRFGDKPSVAHSVSVLAAPYANLAEAHFAVAQASNMAKNQDAALSAVRSALKRKPGWAEAAILQGQILRNTSDDVSAQYLREFLASNPMASMVRVSYARLLVAMKEFSRAREEFRLAEKTAPTDIEIPYAIGLLSHQLEDYAEAELQFKRTLEMKPPDSNPIKFNLGSVAESRKDSETAMNWYKQITTGDYFIGAQMRVAGLLQEKQGLTAARQYLQEVREGEVDSPDARNQLVLAEAQLLRDAKMYRDAFELLSAAVDKTPDSVELLYDRAMVAEKIDKLDVLETDLRKVISIKPNHAHALNALGFTLADRTSRYEEAMVLIQRAVQLQPNDPFIQDSLGWVQFRMGRSQDALETLQVAYKARPDPEIAAHLGVVMWGSGRKLDAVKLWQSALLEHPESDELQSVMQKYRP